MPGGQFTPSQLGRNSPLDHNGEWFMSGFSALRGIGCLRKILKVGSGPGKETKNQTAGSFMAARIEFHGSFGRKCHKQIHPNKKMI